MKRTIAMGIFTISGCIFLCSCIKPIPLNSEEVRARVRQDLSKMFDGEEPMGTSLNVYQALARVIKYNLDVRLKAYEKAFSLADMNAAKASILPSILATAGYNGRNNQNGLLSPENPNIISVTEDRDLRNYSVQLGWNSLDFTLSYMEGKQKANTVMISEEQKRKAIQLLVRDTYASFFRAWAAQQILPSLHRFKGELKYAIRRSKLAASQRLSAPDQASYYQAELWKTYNEILILERYLVTAEPELMELMRAVPSATFRLIGTGARVMPKHLPNQLSKLQSIALYERPELREEDYTKRITLEEVTKEHLRMFPSIELNGGLNFDSNSFLINNRWNNIGLQLSWDILRVIYQQQRVVVAKSAVEIADVRRMVMSMAVITQVAIAKIHYEQAVSKTQATYQLKNSRYQYYRHIKNKYDAKMENELAVVEAKSKWLLAKTAYYLAMAEENTAAVRLLETIGIDPLPYNMNLKLPVNELAKCIRIALQTIDKPVFITQKLTKLNKDR